VHRRAERGKFYDFRRAVANCIEVVSKVIPKTDGQVDIPQTGLSCWYYMSAIQNMSVLETPHGVRLLGISAPPETTLID
jgi:hypothetical protein